LVEQHVRKGQSNVYNRHDFDSFSAESEIVQVWDPARITVGLIILFLVVFLLARFTFSSSEDVSALSFDNVTKTAIFENIIGEVKVSPNEGDDFLASKDSKIHSGYVLKTSQASSSAVRVYEGTSLQLQSNTEVRMRLNTEKLQLDVFTGNVLIELSKDEESLPIEVAIGSVQILGEEGVFEVQRNPDQTLILSVSKGTIEVEGPQLSETVEAGNRIVLDVKSVRPDKISKFSSKNQNLKKRSTVNLVTAIKAIFPKNSKPPKKSEAPKLKRPNISQKRINSFRQQVTPRSLDPRRDEAQRPLKLPKYNLNANGKSTDLIQYEDAAKELRPNIAILRYDSVAESNSKYAELAAHRAAQLVAQTQDTAEVARRYQIIQQRFPSGQLAKPALKELVDTRLQRKELHEARGALNRFIAENPSERNSKDLAFLSAEIFRREKRYKKAITEYQRSMGSQYDEDAMFYSAWAMLQIDPNSEEAFRSLAKYRTQFPQGRHDKAVNAALNARAEKSLR